MFGVVSVLFSTPPQYPPLATSTNLRHIAYPSHPLAHRLSLLSLLDPPSLKMVLHSIQMPCTNPVGLVGAPLPTVQHTHHVHCHCSNCLSCTSTSWRHVVSPIHSRTVLCSSQTRSANSLGPIGALLLIYHTHLPAKTTPPRFPLGVCTLSLGAFALLQLLRLSQINSPTSNAFHHWFQSSQAQPLYA